MTVELLWTTLEIALWTMNGTVIIYFLLLNGSYFYTTFIAIRSLRRYGMHRSSDIPIDPAGAPPVTLIAPAYNEEATCVEAVRALLSLTYPDFEIVVVNDGSRDGTLERLVAAFDMHPSPRMFTSDLPTAPIRETYRSRWHPNLWLIDKANGGKADALNAGLGFCRTPLFCAMDADTLLERDALTRIVQPFLEDRRTVAAGGIVRIANGCAVRAGGLTDIRLPWNLLASFQVLEYLRAFLIGRMGWSAMESTLVISGAFGMFRRSTAVEAGGFATDTVGEDLELVIRLHRHCTDQGIPYRIAFLPDPVAWTEAPETLRSLGRQRDRWQRGLAEALTRHRAMLLRRRYGKVGMLAFPHFYFLETWGPVLEVAGYLLFILTVSLGWASGPYVALFLLVSIVAGISLSLTTVALEERTFRRYRRTSDLLRLFGLAILENLGYRQLNTIWRFRGMIGFLKRRKGWGEMTRRGFDSPDMDRAAAAEERSRPAA